MATQPLTQAGPAVSMEQLEEAFLALRQDQGCGDDHLKALEAMARDHLAAIEHPD